MLVNLAIAAVLVAVVALTGVVGPRPLTLKRDFFFLAVLMQACVYLLVMPSADLIGADPAIVQAYRGYEVAVAFLFLIPFLATYRFARLRAPSYTDERPVRVTTKRAIAFLVAILAFEAVYWWTANQHGMILRRIGTEELAALQASLDSISLLVIRSHDLVVVPLIAYTWFVLIRNDYGSETSRMARWCLVTAAVVMAVVFTVTATLNSRALILLAELLFLGMFTIYSRQSALKSFVRLGLPLTIGAIYLVLVVSNMRFYQGPVENMYAVLNPLFTLPTASELASTSSPRTVAPSAAVGRGRPSLPPQSASSSIAPSSSPLPAASSPQRAQIDQRKEWVARLDCLDLVNRMRPSLESNGYELGAAWRIPALIAVTQFVARDLTTEYKSSARTTAKTYLMERHTSLNPGDYASCAISDVFGNFGFWGLAPAAVVLALIFVLSTLLLEGRFSSLGSHSYLLGLILSTHLLTFEQEFITYVVGWIKYVPITIVVLLLNPARMNAGVSSEDALSIGRRWWHRAWTALGRH